MDGDSAEIPRATAQILVYHIIIHIYLRYICILPHRGVIGRAYHS
jgi:hypothetical protein